MSRRKKENKVTIILFVILVILAIAMFNKFTFKLENKTEKTKYTYTHSGYKPIKMRIEEKINTKKLDKSDNERIYLKERYQEEVAPSARHPFMPPTEAPTVGVPPRIGVMPTARVTEVEKARPILPTQLEPLPGQGERKIEVPEVPTWPTESPILAAGPPQRLKFLLHLTVTGIADAAGRRFAIIEERVTEQPGGEGRIRSYIVREGSVITEYRLKVRKIRRNEVELQRGNQIVELPLVHKPETLPLPVTEARPVHGTKPGSEIRYKGVEE